MSKERRNGDRTVGRIRVIDCLALGEGPIGRKWKQEQPTPKPSEDGNPDILLRQAEEEIGEPPRSKL